MQDSERDLSEVLPSRRYPTPRGLLFRNIQVLVDSGAPILIECLKDAEYKHSTLAGLWRVYVEKDKEVFVAVAQRNHLPRDFLTVPGVAKFAYDLGIKTITVPLEEKEDVVFVWKNGRPREE